MMIRGHQSMINIFFDARTVEPGMTGVGRYSLNLLKSLAALDSDLRIRALFNRDSINYARQDKALNFIDLIAAPVRHDSHPAGDFWLRYRLPRVVDNHEIYMGPAFIIPGGDQPFFRIVTIHDVGVFTHPRFFRLRFRVWLRQAIRRACRDADRIIVPSRYVSGQVDALGLAEPGQLTVIGESGDPGHPCWHRGSPDSDMQTEEITGLSAGSACFLTVATHEPRKDPTTACRALIHMSQQMKDRGVCLKTKWFWIGGEGPFGDPSPDEIRQDANACGFHRMEDLADTSLRTVFRSALAYVSCSLDEGFGLPLVEAMQAGLPMIVSDIPAHREVAGDAALYFRPGDWIGLARLMLRIQTENPLRVKYAHRSRVRGSAFSWKCTAEQTCQLIRSVMEQRDK